MDLSFRVGLSVLVKLWFNLGTFSSYIKCSVAHMVFVRFYFRVQTGSNSENRTNKVVSFSFHKLLIMFIIDYIFILYFIVAHMH
jgi:hypothetical protein